MTEFNFLLSDEDTERLFAIMEMQGANLTGNEFARQIIENELRRLFPPVPKYGAGGELANADSYRGPRPITAGV